MHEQQVKEHYQSSNAVTEPVAQKRTMKFNFFAPPPSTTLLTNVRTAFDHKRTEDERATLSGALYRLLEHLPQSPHLSDNILQLCNSLVDSTDSLRFIWIGLREQRGCAVPPMVVAGEYAEDCDDWRLPEGCFDFSSPYSQASLESADAPMDFHTLFAPWRDNLDACTANCALAIPLRPEQAGGCGLMVFYAADIDYFSHLGVAPFQAFCHVAELLLRQANMLQLLSRKTQTDGLTGLMNRRKTVVVLTKAMEHAELVNQPLSILLCRVEGFDKLNDVYGWFDADAILAEFAKVVATLLPPEIQAGRWTGVEFLYVLPDSDAAQAGTQAVTLLEYLYGQTIQVKNWSIRLTVSIGVATHSMQSSGLDDMIYQAKQHMQKRARQD